MLLKHCCLSKPPFSERGCKDKYQFKTNKQFAIKYLYFLYNTEGQYIKNMHRLLFRFLSLFNFTP